jgi:purine nucleosidase
VTGVNGNVPLDQVFENIQKVLFLIKPPNKPLIAKGADQPLKGKTIYAHSVHGKDGLGDANIDRVEGQQWWQLFPGRADQLISEMVRQYPNELSLVATGPLTNLALSLQNDLEGMKKLKEIVIMGGAVRTGGNITPHAEFNIYSDPLAAKIVLQSGLPILLVPLDVTHQVSLTPQLMEEKVKPINNSLSRFVIEVTGYQSKTRQFRNRELIHLHDPLAVGVVIDPTLVKRERLSIDVEIQEGEFFGKTIEVSGDLKIDVCLTVNARRFLELFVSRLE